MKTLKYAWRFLMRSKSYTVINLLGLAFSLACCIILMRYIHRELTVDAHSIDPEHIIIPLRDIEGNIFPGNLQQDGVGTDSVYIPEDHVMEQCRMVVQQQDNVVHGNSSYSMNVLAVDSTFFHFFRYPLLTGTASLNAPDDAIITRHYAHRIFGKENPVGKVLKFNGKSVIIRGVVDEPECKTLLRFDMLVSFKLMDNWRRLYASLMRVLPGVDPDAINMVSNVYHKDNRGSMIRWKFVNWKDFYWEKSMSHHHNYDSIMQFGNRTYLYILSGVAMLLLLVGILNFINIYMVFMMKRSKEYGVKKVFGLQRLPLFLQIWIENQLLAVIALLTAWLLIETTQIPVNRFMNETIEYSAFDWQLSLGFLLLLPLVTSIYPYIKYNYIPPIISIRSIATNRHSITVRMAFLFTQYVITALLLILSLYFGKHLDFLLNTPTGYRTEGILKAQLLHENQVNPGPNRVARQLRIKQLLNECPHIDLWMTSNITILGGNSICTILNDKDVQQSIPTLFISSTFFQFYDLKVLEGEIPEKFDGWADYKIVLNKAAMKTFGYNQLKDAFVRSETPLWVVRTQDGQMEEGGTKLMPVMAVIDNYYPGHLTEGIKPMAFIVGRAGYGDNYLISIKPGKEKEVIEYLKKIEKEIYNTEDFNYTWLTDEVHKLYAQDRQTANVYFVFALIAIIISCLGLFGLSLFDIRQRYREIAIRKVNGAGMKDLYSLLFRKYIKVIGCAFALAVPLSYYLIYMYTRDFVLKVPVGAGIYLVALVTISLISSGTLIWQIHKAAQIDPAKIIKSE
ncbi:ABC transporter permease [Phocaeicola sartorii]|uniref:ABC transporter permease n=1 Tax=Phocaeicola sartorii TaxID=671267 RepID=UPI00242B4EC5|nr:ABC transporter permease [Phocaeicola sartorii]